MAHGNNGSSIAQEEIEYMAFEPNEYTYTIWSYLTGYFTEQGVAALMGNMWAESRCTPYACQPSRPKNVCMTYIENVDNNRITKDQFIRGGCSPTGGYVSTQLGYGLCQWTVSNRKQGLYEHVFPNYPNMESHSIGNIYYQLEYIIEELTTGGYQSVGNVLKSSTDIDVCSDIVLEAYENPADQSQSVHELRRQYSRQVYDIYGSGTTTLHIYLSVTGNGTATVSNYSPTFGEVVTLDCIPNTGESLIDIIATTLTGQSVAIDPHLLSQTFTMPNESIIISVTFSGAPPVPPAPTYAKHKMPIWMYPLFKRC